jgi:DNA-directed RNA polymerase subunit alpha
VRPSNPVDGSIDELDLSLRAYTCLRRSGILTVAALQQKSPEELIALRNFGSRCVIEVGEKLAVKGYRTYFDYSSIVDRADADHNYDHEDELGPIGRELLRRIRQHPEGEENQ